MNRLLLEHLALAGAFPASTVVSTLTRIGGCSVFLDLLTSTGIADDLEGGPPFTVFAPTDEAFAALDARSRSLLAQGDDELAIEVVEHHVVRGVVQRRSMREGASLSTLQGEAISLRREGLLCLVDGAALLVADQRAGASIVHVIAAVLSPRWALAGEPVSARWRRFERDRLAACRRDRLESIQGPCDVEARRCADR
jgi:uncharacterized surface protein with fasciclin (FAS1) repeats